jgi:hypothetical protein
MMRRERIQKERKPARRIDRWRDEVLPLDPRDPDVVRVKQAQSAGRSAARTNSSTSRSRRRSDA